MQFRNKRKFGYYRKEYSNPFFRRKESAFADKFTWKTKLIIFVVVASVAGMGWFIIFSDFFNIKKINVSGLERAQPADIEKLVRSQISEKRFFIFSQANLFLFDKSDAYKKISDQYYFENIRIKKRPPASVYLEIKEKNPSAVWLEDGRYYLMDEKGLIISELPSFEASSTPYLLIENGGGHKIAGKQANIEDKTMLFALSVIDELKKSKLMLDADRFVLDDDIDTIKLLLTGNPMIIFNLKSPVANQINKLAILHESEIKSDFDQKSYIDLRYGDVIYYR